MSDHFGNIPIQPPESSPPSRKKLPKAPRKSKVATPQGSGGVKKIMIPLTVAIFLVVCYSCLGFFGVPYYVAKVFPGQFYDKTGMVLKLPVVSFNPFTFRFATGEGQVLSEAGTQILSLHSITADLAPISFLRLNLVCNSVAIHDVDLNIVRELDGSYNFQQLFGPKKNSSLSALMDFSKLPFFFSLNNISISDSKVSFKDVPAGKTHTVEKIRLDLPTFSNIPFETDRYLRPHFSAVVNGSPIELTGQAMVTESKDGNQATKLSLDIHALDLTLYSGYLPFRLPLEFKKGTADGKIDIFFNPQDTDGGRFSFGFQLQISGAELIKENKSLSIIVPTAQLKGELQPISGNLHLNQVTVKEPMINSFGKSFLENVHLGQEVQRNEPAASSGTLPAIPYSLSVDLLLVDNGQLRFFRNKKDRQPAAAWNSLQLSIKNYRSAPGDIQTQNNGTFSVSGEKKGTQANFSWQGTFSSAENLIGSLVLDKIQGDELTSLTGTTQPFTFKGIADLHGQLTIQPGKVPSAPPHWNLKDAEISFEDFSLMDEKTGVLTAPYVKFSSFSVVDSVMNLGNVQIEKGTIQFTYGRVPRPFTNFNSKKLRLQGLDFEGKVIFNPLEKSGQGLIFTGVSLKANKLDADGKTSNNLSVSGKTGTGGVFKAQGDVAPSPFSLAIKTGFRDLPVANVLPFFSTSPLMQELEGKVSGKGMLRLPDVNFSGELQLTDISRHKSKKSPYSLQKAVLKDLSYTAKPFQLEMSSAEVDQASLTWEITEDDQGPMQRLADFLQKYVPAIARKAATEKQHPAPGVDIQEISFTNTEISIRDHRLTPEWKATATDVTGKITEIHSAKANGKSTFSFTGKLESRPFTFKGAMDPFTQEKNGSFQFFLENYPLASFQNQLATRTDIDPGSGALTVTLDCIWRDSQYLSSGNVLFSDVKPMSTSSDSALPLALLTGADNTFQLPFDFARTEKIAATSLFDELLFSFQKQIVKGAVSPFLLATGDFTDLIGNESVEFQPGEFLLSEKGREILIRYGSLLLAHPHVGLVLTGGVDKEVDRQALKQRLTAVEQKRVEMENEKLFKQWEEKKAVYDEKLEELQKKAGQDGKIVEQNIPAEELPGFIPIRPEPIVVDEAMLLDLAKKRIDILYQYFTTQLAVLPGRITTAIPENLDGRSGSPANGVDISLKAIDR